MSENKCPVCGQEIIISADGIALCDNLDCLFMCNVSDLPRIAAAMELARARYAYANIGAALGDDEVHEMWDEVTDATKRVLEVFRD